MNPYNLPGNPEGRNDLRRPHPQPEPHELLQQLSLNSYNARLQYPESHAGPQLVHDSSHCKSSSEPPGTSTLNAGAAIFIPRGYQQQQQSVPERVSLPSNFVPQHTVPQIMWLDNPTFQLVDSKVVDLTLCPFKYDEVSRQLAIHLSNVHDAGLMKEIVSLIIEQCIGEPNFRYSGCKLCQYLSNNIRYAYEGPKFRELLLRWCQEEYDYRELYMATNVERLQGFTFFLGELFTQLRTSSGQPLNALHEAVCKLLETLLVDPTNENNLKCVVKTLKVAGSLLDAHQGPYLDTIMCRLKDLAVCAGVSSLVKGMLLSVIELRASNWGRNSSQVIPSKPPQNVQLGTVFYGPNGQIRKVVADEPTEADYDEALLGCSQVEELEGEEAEAFEEFLNSQQT